MERNGMEWNGMGWDGMGFGIMRHDMSPYIATSHFFTCVLNFYLVFSYILLSLPSHFSVLLPHYFFTTSPLFFSPSLPPLHSFFHHLYHLSTLFFTTPHLIHTTSPLIFSPPIHCFFTISPYSHHLSSHFTSSSLHFAIKLKYTSLHSFSHH